MALQVLAARQALACAGGAGRASGAWRGALLLQRRLAMALDGGFGAPWLCRVGGVGSLARVNLCFEMYY